MKVLLVNGSSQKTARECGRAPDRRFCPSPEYQLLALIKGEEKSITVKYNRFKQTH